jgi:hypothetical protein
MNKKTIVSIIIALCIELPIWFYLIHWILSQLNPDRLVWFLFWIYVPSCIITSILGKMVMGEKDD